jgi:hypothetical protein
MVHKPHTLKCVMLWCAQKPNWLACSKFRPSTCHWTECRITFLNNLPAVDRRLIRHRFWGNLGFLPGLGKVNTFGAFQGCGKWESQKRWLNKCLTWTSSLLGRCLRHSFGMLSKPQALLGFSVFISLQTSLGLTSLVGLLSTFPSTALAEASTHHAWILLHRWWGVN